MKKNCLSCKMTFALHSVTAKLLVKMKLETNWRKSITTYDATVDEGQDLSPVTLAILMNLVENPNCLFVADSTQVIFEQVIRI